MASDRMTLPEHVRKASEDGDSDFLREGMERETGLEPATFCLGSRHSTD
jgi:hypothetical protein